MMHSKADMQGRLEACLLQAQHLAEAAACCLQECQPAEPEGAAAQGPGPAAAPAAAVGSAHACDAWRPTRSSPLRSGGGWRSCCAQPAGPLLGRGGGADSAAPSPVPLRAPAVNSRQGDLCSILFVSPFHLETHSIVVVAGLLAEYLPRAYWVCLNLVLCANYYSNQTPSCIQGGALTAAVTR